MIFALAALACAVLLAVQLQNRLWPVIAAVVAGIELLMALGVVRLSIANVPLPLVLGVALAVSGVAIWLKANGKVHVSAATVVAIVGLLQSLTGLIPR